LRGARFPLEVAHQETAMTEDGKYRPARDRRKAEPVKKVRMSSEAMQAYADLANKRAEHEERFGRHLSEKDKGKR
jgi:hypothetical protein